jgi:hypothetical protein
MILEQTLQKEIKKSKRWLEVSKEADVMVLIKKAIYK